MYKLYINYFIHGNTLVLYVVYLWKAEKVLIITVLIEDGLQSLVVSILPIVVSVVTSPELKVQLQQVGCHELLHN